ncbi:hypothetical protein [Bradyrhizobium sp. SZCCHNR2012]|uniref:hypothetical protein n=1 Tax=Bradyrhizobium sp. SZCCHNR2012 TaxID=3057377 RepID=UPI0028EC8F28|nr:hypothetical protein [Bradyrhizobium sp. SZCCHNR2012]
MNFDRLAGLASAVGILLILTIVIAGAEPGFKLKDWQPPMAAIIALGAGTLAYRGAMAKVNFDREKEQRDTERKKLGLYLRLRHAAEKLREEADNVVQRLGFNMWSAHRKVSTPQIQMTDRADFDEAWNHLEMFPATLSFDLDLIRSELPRALKLLKSIPETDTAEVPITGFGDFHPLGEYRTIAEKIVKAADRIVQKLDSEIVTFRT